MINLNIVFLSLAFLLSTFESTALAASTIECKNIEKRNDSFTTTTIPIENIVRIPLETIADSNPLSIAYASNRPNQLAILRDHYGIRKLDIEDGTESDLSAMSNVYRHGRESNWFGRMETYRSDLGTDSIAALNWRVYPHWPDRRFSYVPLRINADGTDSAGSGGMMGDFGVAFDLEYVDYLPYKFNEGSDWARYSVLLRDGRLVQDSYLYDSGVSDARGATSITNGSSHFVIYNSNTLQFGQRPAIGAAPVFTVRWCWDETNAGPIEYVHSARPNWLYLVFRSTENKITLVETFSNVASQSRELVLNYPVQKVLDMADRGTTQFLLVEELDGSHSVLHFEVPVRRQ